MTWDLIALALDGLLVTRRHRRNYTGKRRVERTQPANYLLTPAAYQTHTRTPDHVPADPDQPTGLLNVRDIRATGAFTTHPAVDTVNTGAAA